MNFLKFYGGFNPTRRKPSTLNSLVWQLSTTCQTRLRTAYSQIQLDRRKYSSLPPEDYFVESTQLSDVLLNDDEGLPIQPMSNTPTQQRKWSREQRNIFELVASQPPQFQNLVVDAKAGSGKTTTLIECLNHVPPHSRVLLLAYNTSIARFLATKLQQMTRKDIYVTASTFHSVGYKTWREVTRMSANQISLRDHKLFYLLRDHMLLHDPILFNQYYLRATRLVEKAKLHGMAPQQNPHYHSLLDDDEDTWMALAYRYSLLPPEKGNWNTMISICRDLLEKSIYAGGGGVFGMDLPTANFRRNPYPHAPFGLSTGQNQWTMDFDDMIYLPVIHSAPFPTYDYVMVDEAQDMSEIRREMVEKSRGTNGRLLVFGDKKQSIYGFTGAGSEFLDEMIKSSVVKARPLQQVPMVVQEPKFVPEEVFHVEEAMEVVDQPLDLEEEQLRLLLQSQPPSFNLARSLLADQGSLKPILLQRALSAQEKKSIASGQVYLFEKVKGLERWNDGMDWRSIKRQTDSNDHLIVGVTPSDVSKPAELVRYTFRLVRHGRTFSVVFYADPHLHLLWSKVDSQPRLDQDLEKQLPPETYYGHCKTLADVDTLITAVCLGSLPMLKRSLNFAERRGIRSGSIFLWDGELHRNVGESWSDGRDWAVLQTNTQGFRLERQIDGDLIRQTLAEPKDRFRLICYISKKDYLDKMERLPRPEQDPKLANLEPVVIPEIVEEIENTNLPLPLPTPFMISQTSQILSRKRKMHTSTDPSHRTVTLTLSTCYRCSVKVIREAQRYVPNIRSSINALPGKVEDVGQLPDVASLHDGVDTMIISRFTRDVLNLAFKFTAHWIPVVVQGRRVGSSAQVGHLVKEVLEMFGLETSTDERPWKDYLRHHDMPMDEFCQYLYQWKLRLVESAGLVDDSDSSLSHAPDVLDRYDSAMTLIRYPSSQWKEKSGKEHFETLGQFVSEVFAIFPTQDADVLSPILLTTMHQSRGLERSRVYVLNAEYRHDILMNPTKTAARLRHWGSKLMLEPWEVEEEMNLLYISTTRAKKELYFADWDFKEEGQRWWYWVCRKTSAKTGLGFEKRRTPYGDVVPWKQDLQVTQFAVDYLEQTLDMGAFSNWLSNQS